MKKIIILAALFIGLKAKAQVSYVPIEDGEAQTVSFDSVHTRLVQNIRIQIYSNDTLIGWASTGELQVYCTTPSTDNNNQQAGLVKDSVIAYIANKKWVK